jgi:hypothetical protein
MNLGLLNHLILNLKVEIKLQWIMLKIIENNIRSKSNENKVIVLQESVSHSKLYCVHSKHYFITISVMTQQQW